MHLRSDESCSGRIAGDFGRLPVAWLAIAASVTMTLTACGSDSGDEPAIPQQLVGTYEADIAEAAGTRTISIGGDRSFLIKNPGRRPFSTGPITVDDGELVLAPDEFGDCAKRGTYGYRIADGTLTLTPLNDPLSPSRQGARPSVDASERCLAASRRKSPCARAVSAATQRHL